MSGTVDTHETLESVRVARGIKLTKTLIATMEHAIVSVDQGLPLPYVAARFDDVSEAIDITLRVLGGES